MRDRKSCGGLHLAAGACALAASFAGAPALSQEPPAPRPESLNLFGVTGLIDMPSARVQPDGQLSFTSGYFGGYLRNTINFQVLPRVEGTFRYSILADYFGPGADLYDRSFDLKVLISDETRWSPAIALGLQDFLGTGIYSGEYIVASKALRPNLTVTGGVGWGRFSDLNGVANPFARISSGFDSRDRGEAGDVNFGQFLSGPDIGFFGGVEWRPEAIDGLVFKAEYSPDDYSGDSRFGEFEPEIPFNFGAEYRVSEYFTLGAYAMYGSTFGLRGSLSLDPSRAALPQDTGPAPAPLRPRPPAASGPPPGLGPVIERIGEAPAPGSDARLQDVALDAATEGARWAIARLDAAPGDACPADAALDLDARLGVVDGVTFRTREGEPVCSVVLRPEGRRYVSTRRLQTQEDDTSWHADPARRAALETQVRRDLEAERLRMVSFELAPRRVHLELENPTYNAAPQAVGRAAITLANALPPSVEDLEITLVERSLPTVTILLRRARLEAQVSRPDATRRSWLGAELRDAAPGASGPLPRLDEDHPKFSWFLVPGMPVSLFDPDQPVRADLVLRAGASLELARGLSVSGSVRKRLIGQLDDITRESDSVLPRVRSDFALYA
ncbi:MAG: YjbH domain-containing protein, partial [Pseudomonadota bacterium]